MKPTYVLILALLFGGRAFAETFLVEDGQPCAEIVIAENPTRMVRVAAQEFRMQIEKISGARLPIVTQPSGKAVKVFIGASAHSPVTAEGLQHGAYRIACGEDWMALLGDDTDFVPTEPWAKGNGDIARAEAEWEKIVGAPYGMPSRGLYKHRLQLPGDTGKPEGATTAKNEFLEIWGLDERGSFNAVCGYLRKLGARWYLPGELGEVLPSLKTIPLPKLDETVRPDFALRQFNFRFGTAGPDTSLWAMRLGIRNDEKFQVAHGMDNMTNNEKTFAAHPEWFALYGGKRDNGPGDQKNHQLCYSDESLFRETVRWARALLDTYHVKTVSIMPPDAYTAICQCEKCEGKDSPERHERGQLSDHVWDFVNRVAKEIAKTHPQAKVLNCAYGKSTLPPLKIEKLEPNVQVCIVGGRRPLNLAGSKGEGEVSPEALRAAWVKKTDNPILFFENFPFTGRGWYLPGFAARSLVDSVNATKGISLGEDIWLTATDFDTVNIGFNHFLVYFTARAYWGGKDVSADALLREYCQLFYGPAEPEMLAFFNYCEEHWKATSDDKAKADEALALFDKAKAKTDSTSVHGRRIALVDDFLKGLRMKSQQLGQQRGPVPTVRLTKDATGVVIDGKLDDEYWQTLPSCAVGTFRELQTGRTPTFGTTFKAGWQGNNVVFAIRCEERRGEKPNNTSTRHGDQSLWYGDAVEIEIATETHSYYSIAVSPAGHVADLDRGAPRGQQFGWESKAEVSTHIAEDHWTVEISLPVTSDENDPLHQIIGRKPTQSLPWHINLCRQRIREDGQEHSALSPTGVANFHLPMKFARFYDGKSHPFEADPNAADFVIGFREATQKPKAAAFLALAEGKVTDFQKAAALEQTARLDRANADAWIDQIPIEAVKKAARMQNLLANAKAPEVIAQFAGEDIAKWPFWKRGDGFHARGRAYSIAKQGEQAEADLTAALEWTGDPRTRESVLLVLAQNRETNLKDDDKALTAYTAIVEGKTRISGAGELYALQGIARIQTRQGQLDEALKTLNRAEPDKLQGVWRQNILNSIEAVNQERDEP